MKIIDLTQTISKSTPVYPGDPIPVIRKVTSIPRHGYILHQLQISTHIATHIEAPAHMIKKGNRLDQYPLDFFIQPAVVVDIPCGTVQIKDLLPYRLLLQKHTCVLFRSCYGDRMKRIIPSDKHRPYFPLETIKWLIQQRIKIFAIDTFDFDNKKYEGHKLFFHHNVVIIEGLANLHSITKKTCTLFAIPLKIKGVESSPARVFAQC